MTQLIFARWFGVVSVILSLGILFNLENARELAKNLIKSESGYIMGGVLPVIFGTLSVMFVESFDIGWNLVITVVGICMLMAGISRVVFVDRWNAFVARHLEQLPFLCSLFGLMLGVVLLYVGYFAS